MLLAQRHILPLSSPANNFFIFPSKPSFPFSNSINFRPHNHHYTVCSAAHTTWISQLSEAAITASTALPEDGPVELSSSIPSLFATTDEPSTLQVATSVLLTGAITIFLFRSLRRRAKRAKETQFRSSGAKKSLKEEALESLKSVSLSPVNAKGPPSPVSTLLGAVTAGVLALILYKFTTTIEASLNRQTIPDNYSVRQITITVRTIINGVCYLATFVFGINALGLLLYSGQLAFNSFMKDDISESEAPFSPSDSEMRDAANTGINSTNEDQNSGNTQ